MHALPESYSQTAIAPEGLVPPERTSASLPRECGGSAPATRGRGGRLQGYRATSILLLATLVLSSGCVRSLHPLYTEGGLAYEPGLVGSWQEPEDDETWAFSNDGSNAYTLVYTDDEGLQGTFSAHLVNLDGKFFLDFFPVESEREENGFYRFHLLPVHTFAYVKQIEPTLQMAFPNQDWLKKHFEENPNALAHELVRGDVVLTAPTTELQTFWLKHSETEGAFGDASDMKRIPAALPGAGATP